MSRGGVQLVYQEQSSSAREKLTKRQRAHRAQRAAHASRVAMRCHEPDEPRSQSPAPSVTAQ